MGNGAGRAISRAVEGFEKIFFPAAQMQIQAKQAEKFQLAAERRAEERAIRAEGRGQQMREAMLRAQERMDIAREGRAASAAEAERRRRGESVRGFAELERKRLEDQVSALGQREAPPGLEEAYFEASARVAALENLDGEQIAYLESHPVFAQQFLMPPEDRAVMNLARADQLETLREGARERRIRMGSMSEEEAIEAAREERERRREQEDIALETSRINRDRLQIELDEAVRIQNVKPNIPEATLAFINDMINKFGVSEEVISLTEGDGLIEMDDPEEAVELVKRIDNMVRAARDSQQVNPDQLGQILTLRLTQPLVDAYGASGLNDFLNTVGPDARASILSVIDKIDKLRKGSWPGMGVTSELRSGVNSPGIDLAPGLIPGIGLTSGLIRSMENQRVEGEARRLGVVE